MSAKEAGFTSASRAVRVPVVLQQDPTECAAASLAMLLGHHGRATSLDECRTLVGSGRDGASAQSIVQAARSVGLVARGFACDAGSIPHDVLPVIAHWRPNHFVVVERLRPQGADIVDPAFGRRHVVEREFRAQFSGLVLTFAPGEGFVPRSDAPRFTWRHYVRELWNAPGTRAGLSQVLLASIALQVLGLALPMLTRFVVDDFLARPGTDLLEMLLAGAVAWVVAHAFVTYLRSVVLLRLRNRLDAHVMLRFFRHLLALPFPYFQTRTTGDLLSRASSNSMLREIFTAQSVSMLLDGILVVTYVILLWVSAPLFGALALGVALIQALVIHFATGRMTRLAHDDLRTQAHEQSYLVEVLSGVATVKAAGAEERAVEHWTERFHAQLVASSRRGHFSAVIETALGALRMAAPLLLLLLGARMVTNGELSLGTMLALNALAAMFLAPVTTLLANAQNLQVVGAHLERLGDVLLAKPEQDGRTRSAVESARVPIVLRDVSFRYAPASALVLRDVSLSIEPGTKVAFVGPTGSGKSTLGYVILGMLAPSSGAVLAGGRPLDELDLGAWRRRFGVVLQDSALFAGTVRENIAFHDPTLADEVVVQAAKTACIHDEISAMPLGYDTVLAEGGSGLSGGQKQRIALARALARAPDVLFLDEATSHLDTRTEAAIEENLLRVGCTRLVIAHRLSTIRDADRIFVLSSGKLVEAGPHDTLLARAGLYAALAGQAANDCARGAPAEADRAGDISD